MLPILYMIGFLSFLCASGGLVMAMEEGQQKQSEYREDGLPQSDEAKAVGSVVNYAEDRCALGAPSIGQRMFNVGRLIIRRRGSSGSTPKNVVQDDLDTPLHKACAAGDAEQVKSLLEGGAKIDAINARGQQPIHIAAEKGYLEVIKQLYYYGASLAAQDKMTDQAVHIVCKYGHLELLKWLFPHVGVHAVGCAKCQPIHIAVNAAHYNVVAYLLINGANLEAVDGDNQTPLNLAKRHKNKDIVRLIENRIKNLDKKSAAFNHKN